ncbi:MAG TPA: L-lysine 6-transaminase [Phycisphaerae bacterium]|nr:L-lysine 6-transaminase [Phycisphaerae bacterium]
MPAVNVQAETSASEALEILRARILLDGFGLVCDPQASHGCHLHDARSGKDFLDFYAFFASQPIGYNHPRMGEPQFQADLLTAATTKVANSDVYTRFYAQFVKTLDEVAGLPGFEHFFFIEGGALAIENGLKAAFDWKVRKNLAAGRGEIGHGVIHFRRAFHGRTGYTLSLTNTTDPRKTMYFPKFDWPRIDNPAINFALDEPQRTEDVAARERQAVAQIEEAVAQHGHDLAAIVIEPIQGEGGDHHFRGEFLQELRQLCDRHEMLLVYDEIQTGLGITGKMWCCQHFDDALPDILCFGKKTQVCGIMAGPRIDEVPENVFTVPSRINSTWGGNLADMVRSTQYLRIIHDEQLVERAGTTGQHLLQGLQALARRHDCVSAPRGRGLMCAFDLPSGETRDAVRKACYERQLLMLGCGDRTIRFRPVLDVDPGEIDRGLSILDGVLGSVG